MNLELKGTIYEIHEIQTFESGFKKQEFILDYTEGEYTDLIKFQVTKDRVNILANFSPGDEVTLNFNIRGNEYNGKFYNNLEVWKLQKSI